MDKNILGHKFIEREAFIYYREYKDCTYVCEKCGISIIIVYNQIYSTLKDNPNHGIDFDDLINCNEVIIKRIIE